MADTQHQVDRTEVAGFTSIHSTSVELGRLNVLVGATGAGKSNDIQALSAS